MAGGVVNIAGVCNVGFAGGESTWSDPGVCKVWATVGTLDCTGTGVFVIAGSGSVGAKEGFASPLHAADNPNKSANDSSEYDLEVITRLIDVFLAQLEHSRYRCDAIWAMVVAPENKEIP